MIISPLTGKPNTLLVKSLHRDFVIDLYKVLLGLDVSSTIKCEEIQLYKCLDSNYNFYYPFDLAGDSDFYISLQNFEWYYMPWKWEHEKTAFLVAIGYRILEVGCGRGDFLKVIHDKYQCEVTGLELNEEAVQKGIGANLNILREDVSTHKKNRPNYYDLVCSFQVLEHVPNVYEFISCQLDCLKSGGYFVVAVPNNDSFIKLDKQNVLNMPPHHMGLWNQQSLEALSKYFPIDVVNIDLEPLQDYHVDWFVRVRLIRCFGATMYYRVLRNSIIEKMYRNFVFQKRAGYVGHTIIAIFKKR